MVLFQDQLLQSVPDPAPLLTAGYKGSLLCLPMLGSGIGVFWMPGTYNASVGAASRRFSSGLATVLSNPPVGVNRLTACLNLEGYVDLFASSPDEKVYHILQTSSSDGSHWEPSWNWFMDNMYWTIKAGKHADGRLQVFATDWEYHKINTRWHTTCASGYCVWSGQSAWPPYPSHFTGRIEQCIDGTGHLCIAYNSDHRTLVFARCVDAGATWEYTDLQVIDNPPLDFHMVDYTMGRNQEGHVEIVGQGSDGFLYHNWQNGAGGPFNARFQRFILDGPVQPPNSAGQVDLQATNCSAYGGHILLFALDIMNHKLMSTHRTTTWPFWSNWRDEGVYNSLTSIQAEQDYFFPNLVHVIGAELLSTGSPNKRLWHYGLWMT